MMYDFNSVNKELVPKATDDGFIKLFANVLTRIVVENGDNSGVITRFHSLGAPPISIADYIARIARHVRCSNECFVLAFVYIDRILRYHKEFCLSVLNVHRLVITSVMLAAKFSDDVYYSNKFYALVGGVKVAEINILEAQFLMLIKYQLYVSTADYEACRLGVGRVQVLVEPSIILQLQLQRLRQQQQQQQQQQLQHQQQQQHVQHERRQQLLLALAQGKKQYATMTTMASLPQQLQLQHQHLQQQQQVHMQREQNYWGGYSYLPHDVKTYSAVEWPGLHAPQSSSLILDCQAFVNALESRTTIKRKCSLKANSFAAQAEHALNNNYSITQHETAW